MNMSMNISSSFLKYEVLLSACTPKMKLNSNTAEGFNKLVFFAMLH